jgi:mannitol-specific phosphotransferase system IIBC component
MESNNSLQVGTASGTLLSIFPSIASDDIAKTIILAVVGAVISFLVSLLLKKFTKTKNK